MGPKPRSAPDVIATRNPLPVGFVLDHFTDAHGHTGHGTRGMVLRETDEAAYRRALADYDSRFASMPLPATAHYFYEISID